MIRVDSVNFDDKFRVLIPFSLFQGSGGAAPAPANPASAAPAANGNGGTDYSAQWAEYYRSIGKVKEAEQIEAQMKQKVRERYGESSGTCL